ncbi:MAG: nitrile hydratase accessory protein [Gemmatimonadota bacterium]|nr:nitrile hydratase accessory protein [Gemmatimonadota bacterium]
MTRRIDRRIADAKTTVALPRRNGELVFEAPWEARAFGLAVALCEKGVYEWREFSAALASRIAAAEKENDPSGYYARWVASLEELAVEKGLVARGQLRARTLKLASDPHEDHDRV